MRKFNLTIILCACLFASCNTSNKSAKPSNEEITRTEFEKYVSLKFDNPNDLKEIVEIIPYDTLSYSSLHEITSRALTLTDLVEEGDSIYSKASRDYNEEFLEITNKYDPYYMSQRNRIRMGNLIDKDIEFIENGLYKKIEMRKRRNDLEARLDTLNYHPAIYVYQINFRVNTKEGIVLNSHYSYIDSLSGFIKIDPTYNKFEVLCDEYVDVYDSAIKLSNIAVSLGDDISAAMDRLKEKVLITNLEYDRNYIIK